jgi:hypothetical protein
MVKSDSHRKVLCTERVSLRIVKILIALVVICALLIGVYFYLTQTQSPSSSDTKSGSTVIINEYMASNGSFLPDDKGQYNDWIEVYNTSDSSVNLSGWRLSNDKTTAKWTFPGVTINPRGYMVIFASGTGTSDSKALLQHANFKLNADKGGIYLFNPSGEAIDSEEYKDQKSDVSLGRDPKDASKWKVFTNATPGFINDDTGFAAFQQSRKKENPQLLITELMPSNKTAYADNKGNYSDYIEIYNKSDKEIDLTGYGLSDDPSRVMKWKFPSISIGSGKYMVVFASGEDQKSTDLSKGTVHTNFKLSAYKGAIVLSDNMGYILDQVSTAAMDEDMAYARELGGDGKYTDKWNQTDKPTPGFPNNEQGYTDFKNGKS